MKISKLKGALDHAIENAPEGNELKKTLERAKLEPAGTAKSRHNDMLSSVQAAITSNEKAVIEYEDQPDLLAHNLLFLRQRLNFGGNALGWFSTESKITWTVNTPTVNTAKLPPSVGRKLGELLIEGGPKEGTPNLHGREDSSCLERVVCPLFRSFQLTLLEDDDDGGGLIVDRPLVCEPCQCWPLCFTQSQRLLVKDLKGNLLGQAIEPAPLCCGFYTSSRNAAAVGGGAFAPCTRVYVAQDARGEALYTLKASQCFGPNAWAPSVCNESFDVDVYDWRTGEYLGMSAFLWPGCNLGGGTDRSQILVHMPPGATAKHRAALLAAMLLVEYTAVENRRQCDCNNGTGAMGAPPSPGAPGCSVMVR